MISKLALLLAIMTISVGSAAQDNTVTATVNATVVRACMLDFAPATSAPQTSLTINNLVIALAPREAAGVTSETIIVYETCNENYKVLLKSLNGGLKHETNGYVHAYSASYPRSVDTQSLTMTSAELLGGVALNKTLADWRSTRPGSEGLTPYFEPRSLIINISKKAALEAGYYSETISLEMSEMDTSGTEIIYNAGGTAPTSGDTQVIMTGG